MLNAPQYIYGLNAKFLNLAKLEKKKELLMLAPSDKYDSYEGYLKLNEETNAFFEKETQANLAFLVRANILVPIEQKKKKEIESLISELSEQTKQLDQVISQDFNKIGLNFFKSKDPEKNTEEKWNKLTYSQREDFYIKGREKIVRKLLKKYSNSSK